MWRRGRYWKYGAGGNSLNGDNMIYLSEAIEGKVYVMLSIDGGYGIRQRLYSMGLNPGVKFKVINNVGRGPVGIEVRDTKLAIGRGMTQRIRVKEYGT
jgi:ferrous iron transport protein A